MAIIDLHQTDLNAGPISLGNNTYRLAEPITVLDGFGFCTHPTAIVDLYGNTLTYDNRPTIFKDSFEDAPLANWVNPGTTAPHLARTYPSRASDRRYSDYIMRGDVPNGTTEYLDSIVFTPPRGNMSYFACFICRGGSNGSGVTTGWASISVYDATTGLVLSAGDHSYCNSATTQGMAVAVRYDCPATPIPIYLKIQLNGYTAGSTYSIDEVRFVTRWNVCFYTGPASDSTPTVAGKQWTTAFTIANARDGLTVIDSTATAGVIGSGSGRIIAGQQGGCEATIFGPQTTSGQSATKWTANTAYAVNAIRQVVGATTLYRCIVAHTSTTSFANDFAVGKWTLFGEYTLTYTRSKIRGINPGVCARMGNITPIANYNEIVVDWEDETPIVVRRDVPIPIIRVCHCAVAGTDPLLAAPDVHHNKIVDFPQQGIMLAAGSGGPAARCHIHHNELHNAALVTEPYAICLMHTHDVELDHNICHPGTLHGGRALLVETAGDVMGHLNLYSHDNQYGTEDDPYYEEYNGEYYAVERGLECSIVRLRVYVGKQHWRNIHFDGDSIVGKATANTTVAAYGLRVLAIPGSYPDAGGNVFENLNIKMIAEDASNWVACVAVDQTPTNIADAFWDEYRNITAESNCASFQLGSENDGAGNLLICFITFKSCTAVKSTDHDGVKTYYGFVGSHSENGQTRPHDVRFIDNQASGGATTDVFMSDYAWSAGQTGDYKIGYTVDVAGPDAGASIKVYDDASHQLGPTYTAGATGDYTALPVPVASVSRVKGASAVTTTYASNTITYGTTYHTTTTYSANGQWVIDVLPVPNPPVTVMAGDDVSTDNVPVAWSICFGAASYSVQRSPAGENTWSTIHSGITGLSYLDTTAVPGTTYDYRVIATNASGDSAPSVSDTGRRAVAPSIPNPPADVSAGDQVSQTIIPVSWSASVGATDYGLWRSATSDMASPTLVASGIVATSYDVTPPNSSIWWFAVKSHSAAGTSAFSASDDGRLLVTPPLQDPPDAPASVSVGQDVYTSYLPVSWPPVDRAQTFNVRRYTSDTFASSTLVAEDLTALSWHDEDAAVGVTYYYWVQAVNVGGSSAWSISGHGQRVAEPPPIVPTPPTDFVTVKDEHVDWIDLSWEDVANAESYTIYVRRLYATAPEEELATVLETSYRDGPVYGESVHSYPRQGTNNYYRIIANNSVGSSASSAAIVGRRSLGLPRIPVKGIRL
jgi:fibronectin type 3 domain-containing protein